MNNIQLLTLDTNVIKHCNLKLNKLNLLTGMNGTGKSFCMVTAYCLSSIGNIIKLAPKEYILPAAQFIIEKSYDKQDITGTLIAEFQQGSVIVEMDNGKVIRVDSINLGDNITPVKYLSSHMRLFNAINMYLKFRAMLGSISEEEIIEKMTANFKLYDVTYIESLIKACPISISQEIRDSLEGFDIKENITEFNVDLAQGEFYLIVDGNRKNLTSYGNGHQALFNMIIGTKS